MVYQLRAATDQRLPRADDGHVGLALFAPVLVSEKLIVLTEIEEIKRRCEAGGLYYAETDDSLRIDFPAGKRAGSLFCRLRLGGACQGGSQRTVRGKVVSKCLDSHHAARSHSADSPYVWGIWKGDRRGSNPRPSLEPQSDVIGF